MNKKVLIILLSTVMCLSLTACFSRNENASNSAGGADAAIGKDETAKPLYENSYLELIKKENGYEFEQFQGNIENIYITDEHVLVYSDGIVYEASYENFEPYWNEWAVGEIKDIVWFDYTVLVVEKLDGTLSVITPKYNSDYTERIGVKEVIKLDCTKEEFIYAEEAGYFNYVYKKDDVVHAIRHDFVNGTSNELGIINSTYKLGEETIYSDFSYITEHSIIDFNNMLYETTPDTSNLTDWGFTFDRDRKIENVDICYNSHNNEHILKLKDYNKNIYYVNIPYSSNQEQEQIAIMLPENYTTEDIVNLYYNGDIIIKFKDNSYYKAEKYQFKKENAFKKINGLTEITFNIVKMQAGNTETYILMDDGYLYKIK